MSFGTAMAPCVLGARCALGIAWLASGACSDGLGDRTIRLVGSDTEVNVAQRLAEAYRARHPEMVVSVAGGGSGAGIAALLDGRTDVANASRKIRDEELELARARGLDVDRITLGIDALAVIVHASNPVQSATLEQLGALYRGEVDSWSEISAHDAPVTLYGRQSNSGTYIFFRKSVVKDDYALGMRNLNGNAQVLEAVRRDPAGIGYVGVGYVASDGGNAAEGIRILGIETAGGDVVHPSDGERVEAGEYPISRPLLQYFCVPVAGHVAEFLRFELSEDGQEFVADEGFYRVSDGTRKKDIDLLKRTRAEAAPDGA
jgi:phosphate transport system substrate-binding protein